MEISLDKFYGKPEDDLDKVITMNGVYSYDPEDGHVFGNARIEVDVHPAEKFEVTLTENGTTTYTGEYAGAEITVDIDTGITPTGEINISANGNYDVTQYATVNVNVPSSGGGSEYSYFNGSVDEAGLRAIGWDDVSIGMFRDNTRFYSWQNNDYKVSDENKALYGVVNSSTDMDTVEGMKYLPMIDTSNVTYMGRNFDLCTKLTSIPLLDTSNVTYMYCMFYNCSSLTSIPLLDTSNVTNMGNMFNGCSSLTSIPQLDTSNVTDMQYMFNSCLSLTSIPALDTSNVTNMSYLFQDCSSLTNIPMLDTSNVTDMNGMFHQCKSLTSIPALDTSNVTTMNSMFQDCSSLTSIPLLDTSNVKDMQRMFNGCSSLTSIPLLDTNNVTNMSYMFYDCSSLTSIPLLDTSNVTNMSNMFYSCSSLTSIPLLDTSKVTDMGYLFGWGALNTLTDLGGFKNLSISITSRFLDQCPNLTVESLMNVINNLATVSGKSLKFGSTNLNKLTADQIAIATAKGWTLTA